MITILSSVTVWWRQQWWYWSSLGVLCSGLGWCCKRVVVGAACSYRQAVVGGWCASLAGWLFMLHVAASSTLTCCPRLLISAVYMTLLCCLATFLFMCWTILTSSSSLFKCLIIGWFLFLFISLCHFLFFSCFLSCLVIELFAVCFISVHWLRIYIFLFHGYPALFNWIFSSLHLYILLNFFFLCFAFLCSFLLRCVLSFFECCHLFFVKRIKTTFESLLISVINLTKVFTFFLRVNLTLFLWHQDTVPRSVGEPPNQNVL